MDCFCLVMQLFWRILDGHVWQGNQLVLQGRESVTLNQGHRDICNIRIYIHNNRWEV